MLVLYIFWVILISLHKRDVGIILDHPIIYNHNIIKLNLWTILIKDIFYIIMIDAYMVELSFVN